MSIERRDFLKLAGLATLAGLGGSVLRSRPLSAHGGTPAGILAGKKWGMVIDVSKFSDDADYQRSIDACHEIHNVPHFGNLKDEIKWIWKEHYENVFPGTEYEHMPPGVYEGPFMVLCNHCDHPPCVRVCPTKATFKREDGVVAMDYHRCIGCRFCMAACPYGARSFNWRDPRPFIEKDNPKFPTRTKGVVEKCNFCSERLVKGLPPACVEATEGSGAMFFGDLNDPVSEVRKVLQTHYTIRRKPEMGTSPNIYYVMGGIR